MLSVRLHGCDSLFVADLLATECARPVGIAELHAACLGGGKSSLSAFAYQASF